MRYVIFGAWVSVFFLLSHPHLACANFMVSSAILEFTANDPPQKDISLTNRGTDSDYIVAEIYEILNPDRPDETRRLIEDAATGGLLVTPDKTVLAPDSTRLMRFVLTNGVDDREHVYRVTVKPVIKGLQNDTKVGLKILVGYEILVIVRPARMAVRYTANRQGNTLTIANTGNTNVLFESGRQCPVGETCAAPPVTRVYPGQTKTVTLPANAAVDYDVWDGSSTTTQHYD